MCSSKMEDLQVVQFLPDAAMCSLCREMFNEPVTLTCGHNYCFTCILHNWNGSLRDVCCPQCNQIFDNVIPRPNKQLGNIVSIIKEAKEQCDMLERKWNQCEVHKEPAKLFCKDDYVPVCSSTCEKSREHRSHIVISVEEAAQEYKYEITFHLGVLNLLQENISDCLIDMRQEKENFVKLVGNLVRTIDVDYKEFHTALKMAQMEQMDLSRVVEQEIEKECCTLLEKHNDMKMYIHTLKKKCDEPASQFLQGIKATMRKCRRESLVTPMQGLPAVKEKMWELSLRNLSIKNALGKCRESLLRKTVVEKENITLDPLKAHPWLKLSTDRKMVMYNSSSYNSFLNPQGFNTSLCVLGAEGFSSGRHCWEVELTSEGEGWALGIAKESVQKTSKVSIDFHQGIWALQSEDSPLFRHRPGTFCIRIYLDYEGGWLQFFHIPTRELIYTISYITFTGEKIFPFFKLGSRTSQLKLCF